MRRAGNALAERKQNPTGGKVETEKHLRPKRSIKVILPNTSLHLATNALIYRVGELQESRRNFGSVSTGWRDADRERERLRYMLRRGAASVWLLLHRSLVFHTTPLGSAIPANAL
ncbi:hypothetical protein QQF64_025436 [Cirrhinus molitorella]|uniref:Uncharacterized protein n=1 Tax=Cirrhinus molitorella TaxID=172907 RepID=A0ABR3NP53_9TELE